MYKKIFLIAIVALMLSMGVVSAQQFKNEEFDGVTVNVPSNSNFVYQEVEDDSFEWGEFNGYLDESNQIIIGYMESPVVNEENADYFYQQFFCSANPNLDECYETQEGNMKLLYPLKTSEVNFAMAGVNNGNKTVVILGQNTKLIKQMGESVKFN